MLKDMFWRKKQNKVYIDDDIGKLVFEGEYWCISINNFEVTIDGNSSYPNSTGLSQAKNILKNIEHFKNLAEKYLSNELCYKSSLTLQEIYCKTTYGDFDLSFGIDCEPESYLVAHFEGSIPCNLSSGD